MCSSDLFPSHDSPTSQPSINQIHPIQNPETPNSIIIGNSNLKQEEQHSFLLGYNYFNNTSFLSLNNFTTLNISHNSIQNKSYRDDKLGKTYYQAVNVNGLYSIDNQTTIGKSLFDNKLQLSSLYSPYPSLGSTKTSASSFADIFTSLSSKPFII